MLKAKVAPLQRSHVSVKRIFGSNVKMKTLTCTREELNLEIVLLNGQSFRWHKVQQKNGDVLLQGVAFNRVWRIQRLNDFTITYDVLARFPTTSTDSVCCSNDDEAALNRYLQLNVKLSPLYKIWCKDDYFKTQYLANKAKLSGIRMLKQDPLETVFAFICSANNNIPRISKMVNKLCELYGDRLDVVVDNDLKSFYNFPSLENMHTNVEKMEKKLRTEGFGYRASYIAQSVRKLYSLGGRTWLEQLREMPYMEVRETLVNELSGVGPKVADCICLMALEKSQAVPVDTHVFKITAANYIPELKKRKTASKKDMTEIGLFYEQRFGLYAGWAHSVLFTTQIKSIKEPSDQKTKRKAAKKKVITAEGDV